MTLLTAKTLAIFFALATTAFCVSTIVLAVQKADLEDDLQDALDKLDTITTITTSTSAGTTQPSPTTSEDPNSTGSVDPETTTASSTSLPPSSTTSTEFPWPTLTAPVDGPSFPTLPPNLPNPEEIPWVYGSSASETNRTGLFSMMPFNIDPRDM